MHQILFVIHLPFLPFPLAVVPSPCRPQVGGTCTAACSSGQVVLSGSATRTCQADGSWSGAALTCGVVDPCLSQPCSPTSTCVRDSPTSSSFHCECTAEAFGTPGPAGDGCIVPSLVAEAGSLVLAVADTDDIAFRIGARNYSVLELDGQLSTISTAGGTIDTRVAAAVQALSTSVSSAQASTVSQTVSSLLASIASSVSGAVSTSASTSEAVRDSLSSQISSEWPCSGWRGGEEQRRAEGM